MTTNKPSAKLPVPPLSSTTAQLLTALQPLIPSQPIYDQLHDATINFLHSRTAHVLQKHLLAIAEREECYLNDRKYIAKTTPGIYGKLRGDTLPRNPFLLLEKDPLSFTIKNNQPINQQERAASLVFSAVKFIGAVRDGALSGDVTRNSSVQLDMENYTKMFNSCRVPNAATKDIDVAFFDNNTARHIVVVCNNNYWKVNVFAPTTAESPDRQSVYYTEAELCTIFLTIIVRSQETTAMGIGSVTTETRTEWGHLIPELTAQAPCAMQSINLALFLLILDDSAPETDAEKLATIPHGTSSIVGGIQRGSCTSRWYDKLQLVVCANAAGGLVWENTSMDGNCVLRFIGDVYTDGILRLAKKINGGEYLLFPNIPVSSVPDDEGVVRLQFNIKNELSYMIHLSETRLADLIHQHTFHTAELSVQSITHILKFFGISLDSLVQIATQLAHYALYGKLVNSLEPISTRKFAGSRNELIAVQSAVVEACARAFISKDVADAEKWELFTKACAQHKLSYKNAISGHGWERHYNALKAIYLNREAINSSPDTVDAMKIPLLDPKMEEFFFGNEVLAKISEPEIIIANCGNPAIKYFGIAPAVANGFGIGYIIKPNSLSVSLVGTSQWRQTDRLFDTVQWVVQCVKTLAKAAFASQATESLLLYGEPGMGSADALGAVAMTSVQSDTTARLMEVSRMRSSHRRRSVHEGSSANAVPGTASVLDKGARAAALPAYLNNEIALSAQDMHRDNTSASSHGTATEYILGGYGFFDGGDLDYLKTDSMSRLSSHLQSAVTSRLHSRSTSALNLYQMARGLRSRSRTPLTQPSTAGLEEDTDGAHAAFLGEVMEKVERLRANDLGEMKRG
ncbi:hypothetical protein BABINDRAFT_161715 [Babjeviella inositovora NRRL Y-12698]|uniref:Choline/carnitine acyltransferase domain-containing protein n=1 Tax=Babjeviella inositovora NRRL Y-12698 TaxID=984486 RepID=A0A1E3QQY1_9ASCO|nr:uncharacterized protein BABINDRAFT_161715 [Babjeviella inositovora NRRL Y-12698]ODQ80081.1 hypothetical protein BABINDRAFT_161715 [Babjeviella inositovora NRRL Y-12698]